MLKYANYSQAENETGQGEREVGEGSNSKSNSVVFNIKKVITKCKM